MENLDKKIYQFDLLDGLDIPLCILKDNGGVSWMNKEMKNWLNVQYDFLFYANSLGIDGVVKCDDGLGNDFIGIVSENIVCGVSKISKDWVQAGWDLFIHSMIGNLQKKFLDIVNLAENCEMVTEDIRNKVDVFKNESLLYSGIIDPDEKRIKKNCKRLDPVLLMRQVFSPFFCDISVYMDKKENLGFVYANERWLIDGIRELVNRLRLKGINKVFCNMYQRNHELIVTIRDLGEYVPQSIVSLEFNGLDNMKRWKSIDSTVAEKIIDLHGGFRFIKDENTISLVLSLATGAPHEKNYLVD